MVIILLEIIRRRDYMAGIIFENYIVKEAFFKKNTNFNHKESVNLSTDFQCHISIQDVYATVQLTCSLGDIVDEASPFAIKVVLEGRFEFNEIESEGLTFEDYLSNNAIAILFPYVRALIADLLSRSNEFPALNLPVINVAKMLQEKDSIKISYEQ
ncbi:hypothetical protein CN947_13460 [Bacillus cereus]|nr:hypothetical protein CN947_13460 [Bacillus cereus]